MLTNFTHGVMRLRGTAAVVTTVMLLVACASITHANDDKARAVPAELMEFQELAPFVKMSTVTGDRSKSAHGTFGLFAAGAASPLHTHSGAYHGIVVRGTMTNPFGGEKNPPVMGSARISTSLRVPSTPPPAFPSSRVCFTFTPSKRLTSHRPNSELTWMC
jgi:hypothetical protein